MKILLIGNYSPDSIVSMDKFADMLTNNLTKLGHEVRVIRPKVYFNSFQKLPKILRKWLAYIDKLILFPPQLIQELSWADVVHICDHGNAVYINYLQNSPHVVTCHDLFAIRAGLGEFVEHRTGWTGKKLQQMILKGLDRAQNVVCVSEETKNDLLRLSTIDKNSVDVIPMGLNYPYSPMKTYEAKQHLEALGISVNRPFILHVGANHWYKNRLGVLSIFQQLIFNSQASEFDLVMVGKAMTNEMRQFIKKYNLEERVIELIGINNEDLQALYSSAVALLFPSLYEGFGWPIVEAQACGCPVFTSNRPPMNDVGGEAAIYIEANNYQLAATKMAHYLPDLEKVKVKSIINAQRFSTEKMTDRYLNLYQVAIKEKEKEKEIDDAIPAFFNKR